VLIACAFNYDAHASEFEKLGRIPVLKARMNADLHMAEDLKNTGKGNLFVIFGEPDIDILEAEGGKLRVKVNGVDVFHPNTGEVRSDGAEGIACWFIDTDYNEESFFVRHAYFLGANDPYKALKTTLKAEINEEAWATLNSDTSRPFDKPKSGRIAVKVINHLGDEVMKVFPEVRKSHQETLAAYGEGNLDNVDLAWLQRKVDDLFDIRQLVHETFRRHKHGLVYALRVTQDDLKDLLFNNSMGIESVTQIPADRILSKVIVPADYQMNLSGRTADEMLHFMNSELFSAIGNSARHKAQ
jgi:hypothetical protein